MKNEKARRYAADIVADGLLTAALAEGRASLTWRQMTDDEQSEWVARARRAVDWDAEQ